MEEVLEDAEKDLEEGGWMKWTGEEAEEEIVEVVSWRYGRRLTRRSWKRCRGLWRRLGLLPEEKAEELDEHTDKHYIDGLTALVLMPYIYGTIPISSN